MDDRFPTGDGWLKGQMLIASPAIGDPRFERTVVFMCAHSDEHAMGIVVNKPMGELRLPDLLSQLDVPSSISAPDVPVLNGGPVDRDRGFVLHTDDYLVREATLEVGRGIGLTATKEVLSAIASPGAPERAMLALGYAQWGPGQLEDELMTDAWLTCEGDPDLVFSADLDDKWARALALIGVSPDRLTGFSGSA